MRHIRGTYVSTKVLEDKAQVTVVDGLEVRDLAVDDSGNDRLVHAPVVQVDLTDISLTDLTTRESQRLTVVFSASLNLISTSRGLVLVTVIVTGLS